MGKAYLQYWSWIDLKVKDERKLTRNFAGFWLDEHFFPQSVFIRVGRAEHCVNEEPDQREGDQSADSERGGRRDGDRHTGHAGGRCFRALTSFEGITSTLSLCLSRQCFLFKC